MDNFVVKNLNELNIPKSIVQEFIGKFHKPKLTNHRVYLVTRFNVYS